MSFPTILTKNQTRIIFHSTQILPVILTIVATIFNLITAPGAGLLVATLAIPFCIYVISYDFVTLIILTFGKSIPITRPKNDYTLFITTFPGRALSWIAVGILLVLGSDSRVRWGIRLANFIMGWVVVGFGGVSLLCSDITAQLVGLQFSMQDWIWGANLDVDEDSIAAAGFETVQVAEGSDSKDKSKVD